MDLRAPCANCPFRTDVKPYLTPERGEEIALAVSEHDQTFSCHKHNRFEDDEEGGGVTIEGAEAQHCAGALIMLEKIERPNQWMRIAERLGMYDRTRLKMDSPVYDTPEDMIEAYDR